jgi:hypothetical protein
LKPPNGDNLRFATLATFRMVPLYNDFLVPNIHRSPPLILMSSNSPLDRFCESARKDLLDLSLRNRLINLNLAYKRSSSLRVHSDPSLVFQSLVREGKSLSFVCADSGSSEEVHDVDNDDDHSLPVNLKPSSSDICGEFDSRPRFVLSLERKSLRAAQKLQLNESLERHQQASVA